MKKPILTSFILGAELRRCMDAIDNAAADEYGPMHVLTPELEQSREILHAFEAGQDLSDIFSCASYTERIDTLQEMRSDRNSDDWTDAPEPIDSGDLVVAVKATIEALFNLDFAKVLDEIEKERGLIMRNHLESKISNGMPDGIARWMVELDERNFQVVAVHILKKFSRSPKF